MTLATKVKTLSAAVALSAAGAASATPFYLDLGVDYDLNATRSLTQVCATCTSMKNEIVYQYDSSTVITDADLSGTISAGDTLVTDAGLAVGGLGTNQISGFNPNQSSTANSNNGLGNDWDLSFSISGLAGIVTSVTGAGVPLFSYGPGLLEMFITFDGGATYNNFMDIAVTGGGATGVGTVLFGKIDFTTVDAGFNNLFHSGGATCVGLTGFFDIWSTCDLASGMLMEITFASSQDTNVLISAFSHVGNTFTATTNHNGSGTFGVPEPSSLLLLGGALFGLGAAGRRAKKNA